MADDEAEAWSMTSGHRFRWDIFLSFRGEDTRHGFTEKLYDELVWNGVRTFIDNEDLDRGEEISKKLVAAIEDSAASIAVISKNYAESKWCLEELAKIWECKRLLLPVFYEVDPSNVRKQKDTFEKHFREHEILVEAAKVSRWREAMTKAANTSGWDSRFWEEADLIQSLVKRVLRKLDNTPIGVAKYPVGLHSRLDQLLRQLDVKANGVKVVGLYGMGGVGKTTLAKALYNQFVVYFKKRSFISDVKGTARQQNGLVTLQRKLIGDLNSGASPIIDSTAKGIRLINESANNEQVAIFLDDVDDANQLRELIGGRDRFCQGSRIIVTTRDQNVLDPSIVNCTFEVKELYSSDSLKLLSYHAFGKEQPPKKFLGLAEEFVTLSGGLPLALEIFGSSLFYKKGLKEWEDVVQKFRQIRPGELQDILEISFGALDDQERCIFLDLACLLLNTRLEREDAIAIFKGCGFAAETAITALTAKSLLKIVDGNVLLMHDQLKDMGRQIVQRENSGNVDKRSRLWNHDDIMTVLNNYKDTSNIEGIVFHFERNQDQNSEEVSWICLILKKVLEKYIGQGRTTNGSTFHTRAFQCMVKLRLLQINHVKLVGDFKLLPADLNWLQWKGCPLDIIPPELLSRKIAVLDLSESKITQVWNEKKWNLYQNKMAEQLKVMNLRSCRQLKEIPDLSRLQLEKLILEECSELVKIHPSIGDLTMLTLLNMKGCKNLLAFPDDVSGLKRLEVLILSGCSSLTELPEDLSGWKSLRELLLDGTSITKLPNSIFRLKNLQMLNLNDCRSLELLPTAVGNLSSLSALSLSGSALKELPDSIGNLKNLEELSLRMCKGLISLPDSLGNLRSLIGLYLDQSSIKGLPPSVGSLSQLKFLSLSNCKYFSEFPNFENSFSSLVRLCLQGTSVSEQSFQLGSFESLEILELGSCTAIRSLPSSIGNMSCLTTLDLRNTSISELPDEIRLLEKLWELNLNNCLNLQQLPASIGSLKRLCYLYMAGTAVSELPDQIGMLSSLKLLNMRKTPQLREDELLLDMEDGESSKRVTLPESFSNLSSLEFLDAHAWKISGNISDDFEKLTALEKLDLGYNDFCSLPSSMKKLRVLKRLILPNCRKLKSLPELPSSLEWLNAANCSALEQIAGVANLKYLEELQISNCKKITDIPGLESLKSLKRLYTVGCNAYLPSIKRIISKDSLRHMQYLCVPGDDLPDWFIHEVPNFSTRKHCDLKGVIIGIVLSLDQQVEDNFRHKVPAIVDIQATITTPGDAKPKHTKTLYLLGVPDTDEDQLYLCRFQEHSGFTLMLKEGDRLQVVVRECPRFNGLKLKKHGMHLVFENDDDFDNNDEDLFDESQQSVSRKLANFFHFQK